MEINGAVSREIVLDMKTKRKGQAAQATYRMASVRIVFLAGDITTYDIILRNSETSVSLNKKKLILGFFQIVGVYLIF